MKKYVTFFRLRFITGLQYRAAAAAGVTTQFAWGILQICLYKAFYEADPAAFPMTFEALVSYIWMQQAFLALFMVWFMENELIQQITDGGIAYELCRPLDLYHMWYIRSIANRMSRALLRCVPILIVAFIIPRPYRLIIPANLQTAVLTLVSLILGFLATVSFCMLFYIIIMYTLSPQGIRLVAVSLVDFLSGSVIPLPFLPGKVQMVIELLPFSSMMNVPFRIMSGDITGNECYQKILLQLFWVIVLVWIGKAVMNKAVKQIIVQGG